MKLNQLVAIATGKKQNMAKAVGFARDLFAHPELFEGHINTYEPKTEDGDQLPEDRRKIQQTWKGILENMFSVLSDTGSIIVGLDIGNTHAITNVVVDGTSLLEDIPATHLLFLEKSLAEVKKIVTAIPVLDPSVDWHWSENQGCYVSDPTKTIRTQKVPKAIELSPATPQHKAQVELAAFDRAVGTWSKIRQSAAMPVVAKRTMLSRVDRLINAIISAREQANMEEAFPGDALSVLLKYILPVEE